MTQRRHLLITSRPLVHDSPIGLTPRPRNPFPGHRHRRDFWMRWCRSVPGSHQTRKTSQYARNTWTLSSGDFSPMTCKGPQTRS